MAQFLAELSPPQREAVTTTEGPLMIVAAAGSGKTRVLTYRIAYLMQGGVDPFHILSLTFTNKAAAEMRHRLESLIGPEAKNLWMGTFHSVFAKILRKEAHKLGYPSNFTIYDTDDSKNVLKGIVKELGLDAEKYKISGLYGRISMSKNNFITPEVYLASEEIKADDEMAKRPAMGEIYAKYAQLCFAAGAMDFDDLLVNTYKLLTQFPESLSKYQGNFKYILVDEYQDTNHLQYLIIRKLAARNRNLCVVGDDSQSIYGFRGAEIGNILNFRKDYSELKIIKLEENYRSSSNIVLAANSLIEHNKNRIDKTVFTKNPEGEKIKVFRSYSDNDEGAAVANSVFQESRTHGIPLSDFAILYRTNSQSRSFEESLRRLNLGYRIIGGLSFYQRKTVKDAIAYLRLAINPKDEEAMKRVINYPVRGIGDMTVQKVIAYARANNCSLWDVIRENQFFEFDSRVKRALNDWSILVQNSIALAEGTDAFSAASEIFKLSGLNKSLHADKSLEGLAKFENLQQLMAGIREYVSDETREDISLSIYLQEISLLTDADNQDQDPNKLSMMTIHQAKGLEFNTVYVVGLEENLFPSQMSLNDRSDLEEERRLFYVALTRAKRRAYLSYAESRFKFGSIITAEPSRFINEIDPRYLDYPDLEAKSSDRQASLRGGSGVGYFNNPRSGSGPAAKSAPASEYKSPSPLPVRNAPVYQHKVSANFTPDPPSKFQLGQSVEHERFGLGTIIALDGVGAQAKATISFEQVGNKQILLSYAKMKVLT